MLVESPDGGRALLGRPKKLRPGVLTCLSGFIEQASRSSLACWLPYCTRCSALSGALCGGLHHALPVSSYAGCLRASLLTAASRRL